MSYDVSYSIVMIFYLIKRNHNATFRLHIHMFLLFRVSLSFLLIYSFFSFHSPEVPTSKPWPKKYLKIERNLPLLLLFLLLLLRHVRKVANVVMDIESSHGIFVSRFTLSEKKILDIGLCENKISQRQKIPES